MSEENSPAVEQVSASAEEMSAQVDEVTRSTQTLSAMAQTLQQLVAQFTLTRAGRLTDTGAQVKGGRVEEKGDTAENAECAEIAEERVLETAAA